MIFQEKNTIFHATVIATTIFLSFSSLFPCLVYDNDYMPASSMVVSNGTHNSHKALVPVKKKDFTPPSLAILCSYAFVKNPREVIEGKLVKLENGFPYHEIASINVVSAALELSYKDSERLDKIVTLLKRMPYDLYGDFVFRVNRQKGLSDEEKRTLLSILQYMPSSIDPIRVKVVKFFETHKGECSSLFYDAARDHKIPHHVVEVLLKNGANPDNFPLDFIPHIVTDLNFTPILKKLDCILAAGTTKKEKLKEWAQGILKCWKNPQWTCGNIQLQIGVGWYHCGKKATEMEIEQHQNFYTDVLDLIQDFREEDMMQIS